MTVYLPPWSDSQAGLAAVCSAQARIRAGSTSSPFTAYRAARYRQAPSMSLGTRKNPAAYRLLGRWVASGCFSSTTTRPPASCAVTAATAPALPKPRTATSTVSSKVPVKYMSCSGQAEEPGRVVLEDLRADLVAEVGLGEVLEPAVRGDHREVGTEQDLVFQQ